MSIQGLKDRFTKILGDDISTRELSRRHENEHPSLISQYSSLYFDNKYWGYKLESGFFVVVVCFKEMVIKN